MPSSSWSFAANNVLAPIGIIIGLKPGVPLEAGWSVFTSADNLFLKGTTSDSVVGTTIAASSVYVPVATAGAHSTAGDVQIINRGWYDTCNDECFNPTKYDGIMGDHAGHLVPINYTPAASRMLLIRAHATRPFPIGGIMFGTAENSKQSLFSLFNSYGGILSAGASTVNLGATATASYTTYASFPHIHEQAILRQALGIVNNAFLSLGAGGADHNHAGGTPTVSNNMYRAVVRAFELVDRFEIKGLIGMWVGAGVPERWEVVAGFDGRYLYFNATGAGTPTGNGTISVWGTTGASAHSHPLGAIDTDIRIASPEGHITAISHSHSYSGTVAFNPATYHVKFIRYKG